MKNSSLERIALDIALLSSHDMGALALEMVQMYPKQAENLTTYLTIYEQIEDRRVREQLGIADPVDY